MTTENEILQMDQRIALKDLAKETMEMQTKLEEQKAERDYALKHMNELEHHVMLWRYKITFEIQIQVQICLASEILHVMSTYFFIEILLGSKLAKHSYLSESFLQSLPNICRMGTTFN